jgi:hypothetical protein
MQEINSVRTTNRIVYTLAILGSLLITFVGIFRGECIDYCDASYAEYIPDPGLIAFGITGFLISTLTYQVINLFTVHVEKSHKN